MGLRPEVSGRFLHREEPTMTASLPIPEADPSGFDAKFSDDYIEAADARVRQELGLRPPPFSNSTGEPGTHPDQRPCPSWCWVGQEHDQYEHEVDARRPMSASHELEGHPHVVASLYQGDFGFGADQTVSAATIEPTLTQVDQEPPRIRVALRAYEGRESRYQDELLRLSLEDPAS
jgi:hypothetical protein